ncbi:MAG TPA: hypothetical protein VGI74_23460, partial [Streptosporangiaceae bacterium]
AVPNFAQHGAWVLSSQIIGKSGRTPHLSAPSVCFGNNINGCNTWIATLHLRQMVSYQPASRFWEFQWYETTIFLAIAVVLAGLCAWRIRHRFLS